MKATRENWKGIKKVLLWVTMAAMTLCLGACSDQAGQGGKESKESKSVEASAEGVNKDEEKGKKEISGDLFDHARKTLDLMLEKAHSETYLDLIMAAESIRKSDEYQKIVSADYSSPEKIYCLRFKEEFNNLLLSAAMKDAAAKINDLSEELRKDLAGRISGNFVTMLNARKSAQTVALSSALTTGSLYLDESMSADAGVIIYCYKDAYPLAVSYTCNEEGIVSMAGNVIFKDEFNAASAGDVVTSLLDFFPDELKFLAGTNVMVEVIQ